MMTRSSDLLDHQLAMTEIRREPRSAVTRVELTEAVYRMVGLSRAESARLVQLVLTEIIDCLLRGESVKLSSFGAFVVRSKGPRTGRNLKTGVAVPIPPQRVMVFKPSDVLKYRLQRSSVNVSQHYPHEAAPSPKTEVGVSAPELRRNNTRNFRGDRR